ncbi:TetR/AcrR family transcriptional regulator [Burkholderia sp. SRS-46]|nr:TetR/AcrR family transcriptional regulator [Burkholderia sp. SRS-46]
MSVKRQDVLDTATRLFARFGYQAVGIDRIIDEAGVSKMTMYKYFPSKGDLVVEVLRQREADLAADLVAFVAARADALGRVRAVFDWHDAWIKGDFFYGCMFASAAAEYAASDARILQASNEQKQHLKTYVASLLEPLTGADAAPGYAAKLMLLLDGAIVAARVSGNKEAALEAWDAASELLARFEAGSPPDADPARASRAP